VSKVSAGEISASKSTGMLCSGVVGGSGDLGFGALELFLALEDAEEDETETCEIGSVESDPLEEVLLLTLLVRVFFILVFAMVDS
jgi:hypothetical protein